MENVMTTAWEIARIGVAKFGGKVKEYFAESLRLAWKMFKKEGESNVKVSKWTNERGAVIEMHTEHVTEEVLGFDEGLGVNLTKKADEIKIVKLILNGQEVDTIGTARLTNNGNPVVKTSNVKFGGKKTIIQIALPEEINLDVWGEYDKRQAGRKAAAQQQPAHLCENCGSYCWGDCQAN